MTTQNVGSFGEQIAVDYLLANGFAVLHRNFRVKHLEIDIITKKEGAIYFIEVKTRSSADEGVSEFAPEAAMTHAKKDRIIRAAEHYLTQYKHQGEVFIELIAVNVSKSGHRLRHYHAIQWT